MGIYSSRFFKLSGKYALCGISILLSTYLEPFPFSVPNIF